MARMDGRVVVCGPVAWNHIILLDELPAPVPHMQFASDAWWTVGGTSAGKALHLESLGLRPKLYGPVGDDDAGRRVTDLLVGAGIDLDAVASDRTESHVNLMTPMGERVSIYVRTASPPSDADVERVAGAVRRAEHAVVDLSELGAAVLPALRVGDRRPMTWVDLHDYDGAAAFHEPFVAAADVVLMNDDAVEDPWRLLAACLERGPQLAVCTLGARGAIALDAEGTKAEVPAADIDAVVDTNGAGDAFFAGFLAARLAGASLLASLEGGAEAAATALVSRHLHPALATAIDAQRPMASRGIRISTVRPEGFEPPTV